MYTFPPKCTKKYEHHLEHFSECNKWCYISTPMTTGKRYLDHIKNKSNDLTKNILKINVENAKQVSEKISALEGHENIINPTLSEFEGFGSNDYLAFWVLVIENYCNKIYFVNDWEYSSGCAYEFSIAQKFNIPCYTENLQRLTIDDGIQKLSKAIEESLTYVNVEFLQQVLEELKNIKVGQARDKNEPHNFRSS